MTQPNLRTYFGQELAFWRKKRELTQEQLAKEVNWSARSIQSIEQGLRAPREDLCRRLDAVLDLDGVLARAGVPARADLTPWGSYRVFEQQAELIRVFNNHVVPGLLQTEAYAREVIAAITPWLDLDTEVADRLARQERLSGDQPPDVHVIIAESVLDQEIGGIEAWREQLDRLISPGPTVSVRILPVMDRAHPGLGGPFIIVDLPEGDQMAFVDHPGPGGLVDDAEYLARFERAWEWIGTQALPADVSAEWLRAIKEDLG
ncbi:MAG: helix-turn-helix transcriptional regulator [Actinobacteria bacterium]|nr:helix-turn-helix transcriptional regulator [Actinomycetota bacterium]